MSEVTFEPFQRVLVRNYDTQHWVAAFYSSNDSDAPEFPYRITGGTTFKQCIPYNDETKHLLGTTDSPAPPEPEFKWGDKVEVRDKEEENWKQAIYLDTIEADYSYRALCRGSEVSYCYKYCRHADW